MKKIRLQCIVNSQWRTEAGISEVARRLGALGIEVTGSGRATLSINVPSDLLPKLFGSAAALAEQAPGAPVPSSAGDALPIPEPLKPMLDGISVPPTHLKFDPKAIP
jgi:hypothetical protein